MLAVFPQVYVYPFGAHEFTTCS